MLGVKTDKNGFRRSRGRAVLFRLTKAIIIAIINIIVVDGAT